jgi:acid stress-induced BolA-like protein IbaG/YrbA
MSFEVLNSPGRVVERIRTAIEGALPGARVDVRAASPGHFEIRVVSEAFRGKSRVDQQRLVLGAIAPLMSGDSAPVHAVDQLQTLLP